MKVPLIANVRRDENNYNLEVWMNGEKHNLGLPHEPYFYCKKSLSGEHGVDYEEEIEALSLSTLELDRWYKVHSSNPWIGRRFKEDTEGFLSATDFGHVNVNYINQILIDEPDYFRQFQNVQPLRVLHFDIEQKFNEFFPTAEDPIIAISISVNGDKKVFMMDEESVEEEYRILSEFKQAFIDADPDVVAGYNHIGYDIPRTIERMQAVGIDWSFLARDSNINVSEKEDGGGYNVTLGGRLCYDLMESVLNDQTLHGIKNRKMKTVAKWFKLDDVVDMPEESFDELIGTQKLYEYSLSDIKINESLFDIYFPKIIGLAEELGCPLSSLIPFNDGFPATIVQGRILKEKRIISDGENRERYPEVFKPGQKAFEAAVVRIYKQGYFDKVYKYDFASLYPHIIWAAGTGPDNTRIVGTSPFSKFSVRVEGNKKIYSIPDEVHNLNFEIEVVGESDLALFIQKMLAKRLELKKKAKNATGPEAESLESQQYALKVVLNSVYGINGDKHNAFGSVAVGILIVGLGREMITQLAEICSDGRIEIDTDGIYTDKKYDCAELTEGINMFMQLALEAKPVMKIDEDEYEQGYFHKMKNYILMEHGRFIKHGVAFKASTYPNVFDRIIDELGEYMLLNGVKAAESKAFEYTKFTFYDPEDFVQSIKMSRSVHEYASLNALALQVARDCENKTGKKLSKGTQYSYLKTKRGYEYYTPDTFSRIDVDYYKNIIFEAMSRIGLNKKKILNRRITEF